ncbi:hypothetical protein, partial [uncultured Thiohalocapsa sp.]|uniref:hypothetical protein n=1 Tax=uncultured Thiohalocapsa sp. TaxID=768990 RepID=UPI0025D113E6
RMLWNSGAIFFHRDQLLTWVHAIRWKPPFGAIHLTDSHDEGVMSRLMPCPSIGQLKPCGVAASLSRNKRWTAQRYLL